MGEALDCFAWEFARLERVGAPEQAQKLADELALLPELSWAAIGLAYMHNSPVPDSGQTFVPAGLKVLGTKNAVPGFGDTQSWAGAVQAAAVAAVVLDLRWTSSSILVVLVW